MITKVCGLTARTDLVGLATLPVDWGGFIFVRSSPRYAGRVPLVLPGGIQSLGVFRDEAVHAILHTARSWSLDGVQLHGDESPEDARALKRAGLVVVKAIGLSGDGRSGLARARAYAPDDVDFLLFDTPGGGTGEAFDWTLLDGYRGEVPFLLAGGIGPDSGPHLDLLRHPRWAGIDLNSRFEDAPGAKNLALLRSFLVA